MDQNKVKVFSNLCDNIIEFDTIDEFNNYYKINKAKEKVMEFVFTAWYFVMIALVAGIAACLVVFFKMDKKDRAMIEEFVKEAQEQAQQEQQVEPAVEENKAE